jgi:hypothetical protein
LCGEVPIKLMMRNNILDWKIVQLRGATATSGGRNAEEKRKGKG